MVRIFMGYIVMAYTVMAYTVMAYIIMAYIVMAYIVMADGPLTCETLVAERRYGFLCSSFVDGWCAADDAANGAIITIIIIII